MMDICSPMLLVRLALSGFQSTEQVILVQTDVQQAFLQYRYQATAAEGAITILPMAEKDLQPTTELLTLSFSESMGYFAIYRYAIDG